MARVQHLKISDDTAIRLLTLVYNGAEASEKLFAGSPAVYRRRWDIVLQCLGVPTSCLLTPGGLRGGGAVSLFRSGLSISNLLWHMRIQHASTLESYLQEVTAITALTKIPQDDLKRIRLTSTFFSFLT